MIGKTDVIKIWPPLAVIQASESPLSWQITEAVEQESDTRVNSPKRLSFLLSVVLSGFLKVTGEFTEKGDTLAVN